MFWKNETIQKKGERRMSKFKVGDRVRGISGVTKGYKGVVVEVEHANNSLVLCRFKNFKGHNGNGCTKRCKDYDTSDHYYVSPNKIELIKDETIVIYRKDDKVIALDKRTGKKTEAKCHPDDEFDFEIGAKLSFERLLEEPEQYYNGKIIFMKGDNVFQTGHIYDVVDGKITDPTTHIEYPMIGSFKSLEDIKDYFTNDGQLQPKWSIFKTLEFIEVLDD